MHQAIDTFMKSNCRVLPVYNAELPYLTIHAMNPIYKLYNKPIIYIFGFVDPLVPECFKQEYAPHCNC